MMQRSLLVCATLALATANASAEAVKPTAVAHDEGGAISQSLTGVPGDPDAGREVIADRGLGNCVACHAATALEDIPFHGEVAPMLDGAGDRWSEAGLRGLLVNAKMTFDGTMMPAFYKTEGFIRPGDGYTGEAAPAELPPILTAQQIEDVVAFLMTLKE